MIRTVIDTNVLVSALLNPVGKPAQILELVVEKKIQPVLDDRIFSEYYGVLHRSKFSFDGQAVDELLAFLDSVGDSITATPTGLHIPDPSDLPFLEVALSGSATLITGNKKDFDKTSHGLTILTADEFLQFYRNHLI